MPPTSLFWPEFFELEAFFSRADFRTIFRRLFCDFRTLFEVRNGSKIIKNHSRNALCFPASFRECFLRISVQFPRSPDLKNRAPVYTGTRFSKNRRFCSRTRFSSDFLRFHLRFGPQKSLKTVPKTIPKNIWFSNLCLGRFF